MADYEMIFKVSQAIRATPNASDYAELVAINAIKAMREPTEKMLAAIHGSYPDIPDKLASHYAKVKWQAMIDAVLND